MNSAFLPPPVTITAALSFAVVGTLTPGPNNIMLAASGVNFGMRASVPHMLGVFIGCFIVQLVAGLGLGSLLQAAPSLRLALQIAGAAVTLWLAWKIARAGGIGDAASPHPMHFWPVVSYQAINVKLWVVSISAMALFVRPDHAVADALFIAALLALVNIPVMLIWTGFGAGLGDFLKMPARLRAFNIVMGALLALSTLTLLHKADIPPLIIAPAGADR